MTPKLHPADLPERTYRLGRAPEPWEWPDWTYAGDDGTFGNRYDDPNHQFRVLYAATERETTFRECLARFRPDPAIVAAGIVDNDDGAPHSAQPGHVARRWIEGRRMGIARLNGTYCDVGHSDSLTHLRHHLAHRLVHYKLDDLDAATIRASAPRRFTQEVSAYVFAQTHAGVAAFTGIRYASRLGDELTNWAIFEPNDPLDPEAAEVEDDDPDLLRVMKAYDLTLVDDK